MIEETSTKKGIVLSVLGALGLAAAGLCIAKVIKGVNASEAAAIAGNIKDHTLNIVCNTVLGGVNLLFGTATAVKGVYNILDDQGIII